MSRTRSLSLIVTTYNRVDALSAVLEGYSAQRDPDFELLVADDGSSSETADLVRRFASRAPFRVVHVWQEDLGFRAAAIRNRALVASAGGYIVFSDGDCVPGPEFIRRHRALAEQGWFASGSRVLINQRLTEEILGQGVPVHRWGFADWLRAYGAGKINRLAPLLPLPDGRFRKWGALKWEGAKTCNLGVWRSDLDRINGFDEEYSGWGLEDSDLVIRLLHAGVRHKSARYAAPVFHLWHPENPRRELAKNRERLRSLFLSERIRALRGIQELRHPAVGESLPFASPEEGIHRAAKLEGDRHAEPLPENTPYGVGPSDIPYERRGP